MVNNRLDRLCANILRKRFMTIYCSGRFSQREDKIILHLKITLRIEHRTFIFSCLKNNIKLTALISKILFLPLKKKTKL